MREVLQSQKQEANTEFFKFISRNFAKWVNPKATDAPILSHTLFKFKVLPHVEKGSSTFLSFWITCGLINGKQFNPFLPKASAYWKKTLFTAYCLPQRNTAVTPYLQG